MNIYIPTMYKSVHFTTHPYTIYQITNLTTGRIYIGQHKVISLNDKYCCGGTHIKRAIRKYGPENFKREIIFEFDNFEDMNNKEAELVDSKFIEENTNYNLRTGGSNGKMSEESKNKLSKVKTGVSVLKTKFNVYNANREIVYKEVGATFIRNNISKALVFHPNRKLGYNKRSITNLKVNNKEHLIGWYSIKL